MSWSKQFELFSLFNSNHHYVQYGEYEWLIGAGGELVDLKEPFHDLNQIHQKEKDWLMGCLSYDLKNQVENLKSENNDGLQFPEFAFFRPEVVMYFDHKMLFIETYDVSPSSIFETINAHIPVEERDHMPFELKARYTKEQYVEKIDEIHKHLQYGDIYEINFCQEFYANDQTIVPEEVYLRLNRQTGAPFSSFFKFKEHYILSGSPERYLAKRVQKIISQPIKGTAKRSKDYAEDDRVKKALQKSVKERAENVMIVDLVRNDLSKTAVDNSVDVEELFGLYTFPTVHQLISTVVSEIEDNENWGQTLKDTFPMGSMTGAPKVSAMQLIEELEDFKRGLYSGTVGYITPEGDFDFNVIIRSILYNKKLKYVSAPVGGAITILSEAEQEYEECLLKAEAMRRALL